MTDTTCIYTQGRTGSNYLMGIIASDKTYYNISEFFNNSNYNIFQVLESLSKIWQHGVKDKDDCKQYLFEVINYINGHGFNHKVLTLDKFLHIKSCFRQRYNLGILFKFMQANTILNDVDINVLFNECEHLILNYRNNLLLRWISEQKAQQTNQWVIYNSKNNVSDKLKILWNKQKFISDTSYTMQAFSDMVTHYMNFDKPKFMVCYEHFHTQQNKVLYIKDMVDKAKMNININTKLSDESLPKKQSIDGITVSEHFINPDDFLNDIDSTKHLWYARCFAEHDPNYPCENIIL